MNCSYKNYRGQQTHWDFGQALKWNERVAGYLFASELAGPCGAHYHIWVPEGMKVTAMNPIIDQLYRKYDVVSWSWDVIPEAYAQIEEGTRAHYVVEGIIRGDS